MHGQCHRITVIDYRCWINHHVQAGKMYTPLKIDLFLMGEKSFVKTTYLLKD
tara:strand:- start:36 stop:191 length:156 start_codon:yes stop_codon:yes gene_type:complete